MPAAFKAGDVRAARSPLLLAPAQQLASSSACWLALFEWLFPHPRFLSPTQTSLTFNHTSLLLLLLVQVCCPFFSAMMSGQSQVHQLLISFTRHEFTQQGKHGRSFSVRRSSASPSRVIGIAE